MFKLDMNKLALIFRHKYFGGRIQDNLYLSQMCINKQAILLISQLFHPRKSMIKISHLILWTNYIGCTCHFGFFAKSIDTFRIYRKQHLASKIKVEEL